MRIKYRVGVMPGPWPAGEAGRDFFWRFVDLCEKSEIDSLWFSERLSSPLPLPEPMTAMAAVAARTSRLKFGPSVFVTPFRNPVLMAREIAMVDYLSNGRILPAFGIGAEQEREFLAAGVPFKERGRRTDEAIAIMRRCWSEDEVTFAGAFWQLDRITVLPRPVQKALGLWIGGNSEAAMRRAGRLGDGWIPSFITPEQVRVGVEKAQLAAEAGRDIWRPLRRALLLLPGSRPGSRPRWPILHPAGRVDATLARAPLSARPRAGHLEATSAAPRSSSCARCARLSGCWTSSPSWPRGRAAFHRRTLTGQSSTLRPQLDRGQAGS
jgi:probable F420-dependent oxidoreductase